MCGKPWRSCWLSLFFLGLLLAFSSGSASAEDPGTPTSPPPSALPPNSASPRLTLLGTVSLLSEVSQTLVDESTALETESLEHSAAQESDRKKLSELQTELGALRLSRDSFKNLFETSNSAYAKLESTALEAIDSEALKAARAERSAMWWRRGTIAAAVLGAAGWLAFGITAAMN